MHRFVRTFAAPAFAIMLFAPSAFARSLDRCEGIVLIRSIAPCKGPWSWCAQKPPIGRKRRIRTPRASFLQTPFLSATTPSAWPVAGFAQTEQAVRNHLRFRTGRPLFNCALPVLRKRSDVTENLEVVPTDSATPDKP